LVHSTQLIIQARKGKARAQQEEQSKMEGDRNVDIKMVLFILE